MKNCNKIILLEIASEFRDGIENTKDELAKHSLKFEHFPEYCCGITANLLAMHFKKKECGEFMITSGKRDEEHPHFWLQQDSIIVDITADQFPDCKEPIIVTSDDTWHKTFNREREKHLPNYRKFSKMYSIVESYLIGHKTF